MSLISKVVAAKTVFYHGSSFEFLKAVLKDGLDPDKSTSGQNAVYLTDTIGTATQYVGKDPLIFEIDGSKLDKMKLGPDEFELQDLLESGHAALQKYSNWDEVPWKTSLKLVHQVAYYSLIKPEWILRYHYKDKWVKI